MTTSNSSDQDKPTNPLVEARRKRAQPPKRRGRRWMIAGGVVVFLILFGFFGLPPIVRSQAIKHLSAALNGRQVTIEKVRINPLVLSVSIEGFAITNPDGTPFVGWKRVYVNFDSFSLFTGQWRFQEVAVDDFSAAVSLDKDGKPNFQDLIPVPTAEPVPTPTPAEPASPPRPLYVGELKITNAALSFSDDSRAQPFATRFGPVSFDLRRFNTSGDARAPYQFEAVTESGERFAWSGTVSLDPMRSEGDLDVSGISLAKYAPYHSAYHGGTINSGLFDVSGHYRVDLSGEKPEATLQGGNLAVRDFSLSLDDPEKPLLAFKRFALEGIAGDLSANRGHVDRLVFDGGKVAVERAADGAINALRLLPPAAEPAPAPATVSLPAPAASTTAPAPAAPAFPLPEFTLGEIAVTGLAIDVQDKSTPRQAHVVIDSVDLTVSGFELLHLDKKLPFDLKVKFGGAGGTVSLAGEASADPLYAAAKLAVVDFGLAPFSPYVEPFVNVRLAGGVARTEGSVLLQDNVATFAGSAGLDHLTVLDPVQAENLVTWSALSLNGISFRSDPLALHLDEIVVADPAAKLLINSAGTMNLAAALAPATPAAPADATVALPVTGSPTAQPGTAAPAAPLPDITVGKVELRGAKFGYEDRSVKPAARTALTLDGTITGLSSAQLARADVNLTGKVDGSAPIAITGKLNPLGKPAYAKLVLDFKDIDMPPAASPYLGKYAGYELSRASLNVDVDLNLNDGKIDSKNLITMRQFTLGAATNSPDATKLPVRLGIALLKDVNGDIELPVPVKGSLDDPKFKIGKVVLNVIVNILVKAATSPFSLLGAAFGGGGDELAYQQFAAGAVEPTAEGAKKLETVAKALNGRPALQLDIQGSYDAGADRAYLQNARLEKQVRDRVWETLRAADSNQPVPDDLVVTPEQHAQALLELYNKAFPPAEGAVAPVMSAPDGALIKSADETPKTETRTTRRFGPRAGVFFTRSQTVPPSSPSTDTVLPVPASTPNAPSELMTAEGVPVLTSELAATKLAAAIDITDDDLLALAAQRAQNVRAWITGPGQVAPERVFIITAGAKGSRVDFNLR